VSARTLLAGLVLFSCAAVSAAFEAGSQVLPSADAPYAVLTREGRRPLAVRRLSGQDMVSLDDVAAMFGLTVREDALAGGLTVTRQGQTIVLSPGQALASAGGRLIALPAPPAREGRTWLVPIEFLSRALAPIAGTRIDVRKPSRLVIVGDLSVPRVMVRYEPESPTRGRLVFDVEPATPHHVTQDRTRVVVTFEATALDARLVAPAGGSLVTALHPGDAPGSIVVEVTPAFGSVTVSDLPGSQGQTRFVLDLASVAPEAPLPGAPGQPPGPPAPATPEAHPLIDLTPPGLRTIVIDPGHGGDEHGARGPGGALEKDVTLAVARRLKTAIESRLGIRVLLTRDGDQTVSLDERAARANSNKADLFLSLHANASPRAGPSGAEVFYLSLEEYGRDAERAAQVDGPAVPVFGGGTRQIDLILWEMAQARYIDQSAMLADIVEAELRQKVPMSPQAIQQAPFRVLVGANMPAVLVEMGFITNREDESRLTSDAHQSAIVEALVRAVIQFRERLRSGARRD
jgi:N-acetylmuramoyl-L-alanine amidase